jgi:hypothetical protein
MDETEAAWEKLRECLDEHEPWPHVICTSGSPVEHYPHEPPHCAHDRDRWPCQQEMFRLLVADHDSHKAGSTNG